MHLDHLLELFYGLIIQELLSIYTAKIEIGIQEIFIQLLDCCVLGDGGPPHVAMTVCCLANKEAKISSALCPSWRRSWAYRINSCMSACACWRHASPMVLRGELLFVGDGGRQSKCKSEYATNTRHQCFPMASALRMRYSFRPRCVLPS